MRFSVLVAVVTSAWVMSVLAAPAAQTSTWSGVYTEAQATTGLDTYTKNCSECHGDDLGGDGFAPALKGPEFMNNWNGLPLSDLFERIRSSMPPSDPNAVTAKEKADIVAYILKQDGFPAGTTELPAETEALKGIKFEATKPGR